MKNSLLSQIVRFWILVAILLFSTSSVAQADKTSSGIGEAPDDAVKAVAYAIGQSLGPVVTEYGKVNLSMDALGILGDEGYIHINKPSGATVRRAYLLSATTGFTGYQLASGDVKLNDNQISWERSIPNSISSYNYWADVTNNVKSVIDAAPAGIVALGISEINSLNIDGEILAVIFDDPNQTTNNTIILYFGAQNISGDTFTINTGKPLNTADPNFKINLSLGISYGYYPSSQYSQYSQVDVNGVRLTTSAGCQDDGENGNGALITVGGIGDLETNPVDPYAIPASIRQDDELYNLKPFVKTGDTTIRINTINPSNDDNIFFAALFLKSTNTTQNIDIDISLSGNPTTTEEKAPYENIVKYFADSVYESSNGINKLGTVTFHVNGAEANQSDIVWTAKGHPSSSVAGFGTPGKHVNMYDVFQDGGGKGIDYDFKENDEHQRAAGYTLGHEFGHLYYSLYDEYKYTSNDLDCAIRNLILSQPHCSDTPVPDSVMNSQFNALNGNYSWLNFSITNNITPDNAQYRVYRAAGWETLARPISEDPKTPWWSAIPSRLYHSELASVKPKPNTASPIELPGTARSELKIVWEPATTTLSNSPAAITTATGIPYTISVNSVLGNNISYPAPIILEAFVHQDLFISNLNVIGNVVFSDGTAQEIQFLDNGIAPDVLEKDGIYTAMLNYSMGGLFSIQVTMDNHALAGNLVAEGLQMSTDIYGNSVPYPDPQPVTDDFVLSKSLTVAIGNVTTDDHGNIPDHATAVPTNNSPVTGKIEYAGDPDVFKVTTRTTGYTIVRITNMAFGIAPHLRVLGPDKLTVLYEKDPPIAEDGYINVLVKKVLPGTPVYVEITDKNGNSGGIYQVSAGGPLASDSVNNIHVYIGKPNMGNYFLPDETVTKQAYGNIVNGPVKVSSIDAQPFITTQVVTSGGSYNELAGYPVNQFTTEYWFPYYDHGYPNVPSNNMRTWILVGNPSDTLTAEVEIRIGGILQGSYSIPPGANVTPRWIGLIGGPVQVISTNGVDIFASERVFTVPYNSFNEVMGYPSSQFTTEYWFPWYDTLYMNTYLLVGNTSSSQSATVEIYIGAGKMGTYNIAPNSTLKQRFASKVDGPVRVVSTNGVDIVASEITLSGTENSFNEVMGYPFDQFDTEYWFPYYDHGYPNVSGSSMRTWILVGNPSASETANVEIYVDGVLKGTYSITPGANITPRWIGSQGGPVRVVSDIPIFVSERVFTVPTNAFNEFMGIPLSQITTQYWFTWYDSINMNNTIVISKP